MRHPDPKELQRLVDGELSRRRTQKLSEHTRSCPKCASAVERIRAMGDLFRLASDDALEDAPLDGFADLVMGKLEESPRKLPWTERTKAWFSEFYKYKRHIWAPPLIGVGAAAAATLIFFGVYTSPPPVERPPGASVLSVTFGSTVDGTVFEFEDKDGSTSAVIWVDESKTETSGDNTEASRNIKSGAKVAIQWTGDNKNLKVIPKIDQTTQFGKILETKIT